MISLDTETTGVDLRHGARPFFVTTCNEEGELKFWEWDVNPLDRTVEVPEDDARAIRQLLAIQHDGMALQNVKFDATALLVAEVTDWTPLWPLTFDTLIAGHLLASNQPHDLTSMAMQYLGVDIEPYELKLKEAVNEARRLVRREFSGTLSVDLFTGNAVKTGEWRIAKRDLPEMPSAKESTWKFDSWLPRAVAKELGYSENHSWWTVLRDYANADSSVTLPLWKAQRAEIERRGLWKIYQARMRLLPVAFEMERRGVTLSAKRLAQLEKEYSEESEKAGQTCLSIAKEFGFELELPKSGANKSLREFVFKKLKLPPIYNRKSKTAEPTLDKAAMETYELTLSGKPLEFVKALRSKRKQDTALAYMEGYRRFWLPLPHDREMGELFKSNPSALAFPSWRVLHPSLNPTGTDTLRWSSNNPNEQNISKQEGFNLRFCFGPAPGREWWSLDAQNIELRIPAFEAGEKELMRVFLEPEEPPHFGSYHLLIFDLLHPELFAKHGVKCKTLYESTHYQWVKNGNFAIIYGAQEGTVDATYRVNGAYRKIRDRFPKIAELSDRQVQYANKFGWVETIPDKSVDAERGYPLLCSRSDDGSVMPTVPLNYHVQGTAMWWMGMAMIRCCEQLREWRREGFDGHLTMQVHDELVFDFPRSVSSNGNGLKWGNLPKIRKLQALMEKGGEGIGVPTPVSVKHHSLTWSEGVTI